MDPIAQDGNLSQSSSDQQTPPPASPAPKPSVVPIIFTIILLISLAGVGILTYQNRLLQQQIAVIKLQPTPSPTPTSSCVTPPPECITESGSIKPECSPPFIGEYCVPSTCRCPDKTVCPNNDVGLCPEKLPTEGTLKAAVIRSPTCPGPVTEGKDCEAPDANETFQIISLLNNEMKQTVTTDKDGKFTISLTAGSYKLQDATGRIDKFGEVGGIGKNISNSTFTITAGKTTTQRFDVDTGIR